MKKIFAVLILAAASLGVARASGWVAAYALIDKVVPEPNADKPERIQVWGVFMLAGSDAPQRGYLYFALPAPGAGGSREEMARREWNDLRSAAGTHQVVSFGEVPFANQQGNTLRSPTTVRKANQKPDKPDLYDFGTGVVRLRSDTDYAPVRVLLDFHE